MSFGLPKARCTPYDTCWILQPTARKMSALLQTCSCYNVASLVHVFDSLDLVCHNCTLAALVRCDMLELVVELVDEVHRMLELCRRASCHVDANHLLVGLQAVVTRASVAFKLSFGDGSAAFAGESLRLCGVPGLGARALVTEPEPSKEVHESCHCTTTLWVLLTLMLQVIQHARQLPSWLVCFRFMLMLLLVVVSDACHRLHSMFSRLLTLPCLWLCLPARRRAARCRFVQNRRFRRPRVARVRRASARTSRSRLCHFLVLVLYLSVSVCCPLWTFASHSLTTSLGASASLFPFGL